MSACMHVVVDLHSYMCTALGVHRSLWGLDGMHGSAAWHGFPIDDGMTLWLSVHSTRCIDDLQDKQALMIRCALILWHVWLPT
jgi:hypothetical protein